MCSEIVVDALLALCFVSSPVYGSTEVGVKENPKRSDFAVATVWHPAFGVSVGSPAKTDTDPPSVFL